MAVSCAALRLPLTVRSTSLPVPVCRFSGLLRNSSGGRATVASNRAAAVSATATSNHRHPRPRVQGGGAHLNQRCRNSTTFESSMAGRAAQPSSAAADSASSSPARAPGTPVSQGMSLRLWDSTQAEVAKSRFHPFVLGIAKGDLPRSAFQHYIGQDAFFLEAFARAYALAAAKSHCQPSHVTESLVSLMKGVFEELTLHKAYATEWGVDLSQCRPSSATLAYTSFVLKVANGDGGVAAILAAMAPCMRLYAHLGCQLKATIPTATAADNPYAEWVRTYSSADFQALAEQLEAILDELVDDTDYESLLTDYRTAMQLEANFFSAQPGISSGLSNTELPRLLVTDFDETITTSDTTPVIIEQAFQAAEEEAGTDGSAAVRAERTANLEAVLDHISTEKKKLLAELSGNAKPEGSAFDEQHLHRILDALSDYDMRMNEAAFSSGIITGVRPERVAEAGRSVPLQEGAHETLQRALLCGVPVKVLSVSWCDAIIHGALGFSEETLTVSANSLELGEGGGCSGRIIPSVQCANDKAATFASMLAATETGTPECRAVYIGDSATDLAPLLQADLGIVIGSNGLLRTVAAAAGVTILPLLSAAASLPVPGQGIIYQADSWWDIAAFLLPEEQRTSGGQRAAGGNVVYGVPRVMTVAGSDSGGGAGIQADLKAFLARGTFGMSTITALTAQNTEGVQGVLPIEPSFVEQQMESVLSDIGVDAVKTGMLPNANIIHSVAKKLKEHSVRNVVVDPVLVATSGHSLADSDATHAIITEMMPIATVITPNLAEASALLGGRRITGLADMREAAQELHALGPESVLIKGGHLQGQPDAVDVLFDGAEVHELRSAFVDTENLHGTGCTLAASIASELAKGYPLLAAVSNAKGYLTAALQASATLSIGQGCQKPFNHGYRVADWSSPIWRSSVDYSVYAVTDPACNESAGRTMLEAVKAAIAGGATVIQLREKDSGGRDFVALAREVMKIARPAGIPVLINDRLDVALASGADGAHVGQSDINMQDARRLLGPSAIIGVSVRTVKEALQAEADGADYVGAGAVYVTATKADAQKLGNGLRTLKDICAAVSIPVVGIGGIGAANAAPVIHCGATGVAVVSSVFAAPDVAAAVAELKDVVEGACRGVPPLSM